MNTADAAVAAAMSIYGGRFIVEGTVISAAVANKLRRCLAVPHENLTLPWTTTTSPSWIMEVGLRLFQTSAVSNWKEEMKAGLFPSAETHAAYGIVKEALCLSCTNVLPLRSVDPGREGDGKSDGRQGSIGLQATVIPDIGFFTYCSWVFKQFTKDMFKKKVCKVF